MIQHVTSMSFFQNSSRFQRLCMLSVVILALTLLLVTHNTLERKNANNDTGGGGSFLRSGAGSPRLSEGNETQPPTLDYSDFGFETTSASAPTCHAPINETDIDFTLVTQLSLNRLGLMKHHCSRWGDHPMSIAVATGRSKIAIVKALQALGCNTGFIKITTVPYGITTTNSTSSAGGGAGGYPVNKLRNAAMAGVRTSHAVVIDADFVLSRDAYQSIVAQRAVLAKDPKAALVLPAFELRSFCDDCKDIHTGMLPETKHDLLSLLDIELVTQNTSAVSEPTMTQFDIKGNKAGHGSTRYNDWIKQDDDEVLPIECVTSNRYEPYLVVRYCSDLPPFQEAFTGYGQNKLTWFQQLRRTGYKLFQMGGTFVVHFPHAKSTSFKKWEKERKHVVEKSEVSVNKIAALFQQWMEDNVPNQSVLPEC